MPRKRKLSSSREQVECPEGISRKCLKCAGWFCSSGAGNRLCVRCFDDNTRVSMRHQAGGSTPSLPTDSFGGDF